jgi:hypothetical protein
MVCFTFKTSTSIRTKFSNDTKGKNSKTAKIGAVSMCQ